jgi:hypothetical protein
MLEEVIKEVLTSRFVLDILVVLLTLVVSWAWVGSYAERRKDRKQSREIADLQAEIGKLQNILRGSASQQRGEKEDKMEPTILTGLVGSVASIISLIQQNNEFLHPKTILDHFRKRQNDPSAPEYQLGRVVKESDIVEQAEILLAIFATDSLFLDRITKKCLGPYYDAIKNHDLEDIEVVEQRNVTARCVCRNIKLALDDNGGRFPNDAYKELWEQFGCH